MIKSFLHSLKWDIKYIFDDILLAFKHPKRKDTYTNIKYHFSKITDTLVWHPWYCLKRGIRNFFIWRKIIWGLDCYDHSYLHTLMDKQLEEMEKFFSSGKTHCTGANHRAKRMRWIRKLLEMHREDYYVMKDFDQRYSDPDWENMFKSKPIAFDEYGIPTMFEIVNDKPEEQRQAERDSVEIARDKDEKVHSLLWDNLKKHSRNFWD